MICALIMAGGKGTRFWPLSTDELPKQFLCLTGEKAMIQETFDRITSVIPPENVFVCTSRQYVNLVKEHLSLLPNQNIIIEPEARNTAPCIALSAFAILRLNPNITSMIVLPSDHLITQQDEFCNIIVNGNRLLQKFPDHIFTLGIQPDRPETGYGYIKQGEKVIGINNQVVFKVEKFVEKPNRAVAEEYLQEGSYLWNSGMFIWNINHILSLMEAFQPTTYQALMGLLSCEIHEFQNFIDENYHLTEATSVDYAILEKTSDIYVIPSQFGWDDLGNWSSFERYNDKDINGNVLKSVTQSLNSTGNIVITKKPIVLNDINDLIIVETEDYILISSKKDEQNIRKAKGVFK